VKAIERKSEMVPFRMTRAEKAALRKAAELASETVTDFIRGAVLQRVERPRKAA